MLRRFRLSGLIFALVLAAIAIWAGGSRAARPGPAADRPAAVPTPAHRAPDSAECNQITARGIDRQMNLHAGEIMIRCGKAPGGGVAARAAAAPAGRPAPAAIGGGDVNAITGSETYPAVTQSESMVWGNGSTTVINYNDSATAPGNYSGVSVSTNAGISFTRLLPSPFTTGHGTNYGDPILVYNGHLGLWFAGDLATGCGGQGIGFWTSPNGLTWTPGACAHAGSDDDRESMWVDNNPASPFYGRMYVSWNDFAVGARIYVVYSDDGTTWSAAIPVGPASPFVRNGQVTGSPNGDGAVFISGHTESSTDTTYLYRSTAGGATWTALTVNTYIPAGDTNCGFNAMSPIWRAPEWGQPAVGPQIAGQNVVHYVYAAQNGSDPGDVLYVRSTDNGTTWGAPVKLNTDTTTRAQWQPSLSVDAQGGVLASWYDRRNTTTYDYEYYGRVSTDNGVTWQADQPISDQIIAQPQQPDPNVVACYAGDYNYHSANGNVALITWTDGRVAINSTNQQDVF
ncbi:MAG TPA: sialidase family protein, partial [Chloroflexia bacterium]|nr:sialidase family protein [Chloroflexia bacterium]